MSAVCAVLCLGSNSGKRELYIDKMEQALEMLFGQPLKKSRLMETEPVDVDTSQEWYLNRVVTGKYSGSPQELLEATQEIERALGRTDKGNYQSRTADIDILLFGCLRVESKGLTIPHKGICSRRFVLEGLADIVPDMNVPECGRTVQELYTLMEPQVKVQAVRWVALK